MECKSNVCRRFSKSTLRINRYIMECKYTCDWGWTERIFELIDTLWNVNIEGI